MKKKAFRGLKLIVSRHRYTMLLSDAVWDLLPDYKERDPPARDALDVYINHRLLMEARTRQPGEPARPANNQFPPELMRRYDFTITEHQFNATNLTSQTGTR